MPASGVENQNKDWNYHPDLPLQDPSPFTHLNEPRFLIGWLRQNWLSLSERVLLLILAVALWYFAYPSLKDAQTFTFG